MKVLTGIIRVLARAIYVVMIASLMIAAPLVLGYKPVVVLSPSMVPDYPVGSITYYKAVTPESIQVGDAITFKFGDNSLATHRVVEKDEANRAFTTKGDNNTTPDPSPVSYDEVVGKTMAFALPYAGFVAREITGKWYIVGGLAVILLIDMMLPAKKKPAKGASRETQLAKMRPYPQNWR